MGPLFLEHSPEVMKSDKHEMHKAQGGPCSHFMAAESFPGLIFGLFMLMLENSRRLLLQFKAYTLETLQ